jgi:hypothetical protein
MREWSVIEVGPNEPFQRTAARTVGSKDPAQ